MPLTGNSAGAGAEAKAAIEVAADILNAGHPELKGLTIGLTPGLPALGGARIEPVFVDHRGDPSVAQSLALKLITGDKVAALMGAYQSSCAMTATAVSERYGVPFIISEWNTGPEQSETYRANYVSTKLPEFYQARKTHNIQSVMYYVLDSGNDTYGIMLNGTAINPTYNAFASFTKANPDN